MPNRTTTANIAYDGEALRSGSMDVRELAPALLAVGSLLDRSSRVLNGDRAELAVKVRSNFETGSFDIYLEVIQSIAAQAHMFLSGDQIKSAKDIAEIVGLTAGSGISLLKLIKLLRGKTPSRGVTLENGNIELTIIGDNNHVEVRPDVFQLAGDVEIRKAASAVMKPLESKGIERFEVREGKKIVECYGRDDLPSFALPEIAEREISGVDQTQIIALEVIKPSFEPDLTWVFSDGSGGKINALMKDPNYLNQLDHRDVAFTKGTILRLKLRSKRYATATGLRTEHEVLHVLETITQPRPIHLPLAEPLDPPF